MDFDHLVFWAATLWMIVLVVLGALAVRALLSDDAPVDPPADRPRPGESPDGSRKDPADPEQ
jgi:hypothetical protein